MFKSKLPSLLFFLALTLSNTLYSDEAGLTVSHVSVKDNVLIKDYYLLADSSGDADVAVIAERIKNGDAILKKGSVFSSGYSELNQWIAFTVENTESELQNMVFEVGDPHINRLDFYKISDTSIVNLGTAGDLGGFNLRDIADNNFIFQFPLQPNEKCMLLLKVDNKGHTTMMPFSLKLFSDHYSSTVTEYLLWGLLTGILLFVCLFSLLIYFSLKEKLFLFYSIYIFTILMWIWSNNGLGYQFLYPELPDVMARIRLISAAFGIVLMLHVMQLFTNQSRDNSRFFRVTNFVKIGLCLMGLILFIPYDYNNDFTLITVFLVASDILVLLSALLLFAGLIEKIKQGQQSASVYLTAVSVFFISVTLTLSVRLGIIQATALTLNIVYIGILIEVLILAFALSQRYKALSKEEQRLQIEIETQKKDTLHKMELAAVRERSRIAADLHDDIGSGISGLRLFSEMAERKNTIEELKSDTMKITETAAMLADKIRDVVWTLDADNKNLESFLLYLHKYGIRFFENSAIEFKMNIPFHLTEISLSAEKQKQLLLAFKEIFNNALKHSGANKLDCEVSTGDLITITITDNGNGFNTSLLHKGKGLDNISKRIHSINGTVDIETNAGTVFTISIPV
jgi:signal transduction histidine kinase